MSFNNGKLKKSYGILCFRPSTDGYQILMIKKSTTYHFCEFVSGHYKKHNEAHLKKLFNNMTYHEKMDILGMQFGNMWYRVYKENPMIGFNSRNKWTSLYLKREEKFKLTFMQDGGLRLKSLIADSDNVETPWEFPKGRKDENKREGEIETAMREFYEETGVSSDKYRILWHLTPYKETYTDFGITYQHIYYFAEAIGQWEPVYKFQDKMQISEISAVRWIQKKDLSFMQLEKTSHARLVKCFDKILRKYKNSR